MAKTRQGKQCAGKDKAGGVSNRRPNEEHVRKRRRVGQNLFRLFATRKGAAASKDGEGNGDVASFGDLEISAIADLETSGFHTSGEYWAREFALLREKVEQLTTEKAALQKQLECEKENKVQEEERKKTPPLKPKPTASDLQLERKLKEQRALRSKLEKEVTSLRKQLERQRKIGSELEAKVALMRKVRMQGLRSPDAPHHVVLRPEIRNWNKRMNGCKQSNRGSVRYIFVATGDMIALPYFRANFGRVNVCSYYANCLKHAGTCGSSCECGRCWKKKQHEARSFTVTQIINWEAKGSISACLACDHLGYAECHAGGAVINLPLFIRIPNQGRLLVLSLIGRSSPPPLIA